MINFSELFCGLVKCADQWQLQCLMKNSVFAVSFLLALSLSSLAQDTNPQENPAQNPENNNNGNNRRNSDQNDGEGLPRFWEANLGGGNYAVALDRISSVSRHKYVLDGALIVDEVTIDTVGQALARFYYITPITSGVPGAGASQVAEKVLGLVDSAARTSGSDLQNMVVKKYPLTTHAKSIEYRLLSEAQLNALFQSAKTAWQTGKGRIFTGR